MSRTFGHTKHNRRGCCLYRSARKFKTDYNRALRGYHRDILRAALKNPEGPDDVILTKVREIRDIVNHPGDLW